MPKKIEMTGRKFGRLKVIKEIDRRENGRIAWECICDCGKIKTATTKSLRNGGTKSCGCLHSEKSILNGKWNEKPVGCVRIHKLRGRPQIKTRSGWMDEHRLIMEEYLCRKLSDTEVVHHCNRNVLDNRIENLELMLHGEHTILHHTGALRSMKTKQRIRESKKGRHICPE